MTAIEQDSRLATWWRAMVEARAFDQAMCRHNGHWHEARGEEAVFVGAFAGLRDDDVLAPHFRGACAVSLLRGADPARLAAGVFGTADSPSGGRWRGDICPSPGPRFVGMFSGSLGTSVAYAAGAALSLQRAGGGSLVVSAFGDGTANAGIVAETLNLASMLQLPIVFVCQNNQYATSLRADVAMAGAGIARRAEALGIPSVEVDGNDVTAVFEAREEAAARARAGGGPSLIHALTYRMGGHYMNDPEVYRTSEEVEAWAARDPLARAERALVEAGQLTADEGGEYVEQRLADLEQIVATAKTAQPSARPLPNSAFAESTQLLTESGVR